MKKCIFLFLSLLITTSLFAQSKLHIKGQPQKSSSEIVGKRDANGDFCAAIKVISDMDGFSYDAYNGVVEVDDQPGKDMVYLSTDERVLEVFKSGYEPMKIILSEVGIKLEEKAVWEINLTGDAKTIPINIITEPEDAIVYIDAERKGTGKTHKIPIGKHTLKLEKQGYNNITDEIDVSESNTLFEYNLEDINPIMITIKSQPSGANILIDNVNEGRTNKQIFKFPGVYNLKLIKNNFETINKNINVKENSNNTWNFNLVKTTGKLTINTTPPNTKIYLNGEHKSSNEIEAAPGKYKVEVKKDGYYSTQRIVEIKNGESTRIDIDLVMKKGNLQVEVEPMKTEVILKKNDQEIKRWNGSNYLQDLGVGEYQLYFGALGHKDINKEVVVKENRTESIDVSLNKNNQKIESNNIREGLIDSLIFIKGDDYTIGLTDKNKLPNSHKVKINSFYISKYEISQNKYIKVMNKNPSFYKGNKRPVENVSWYDAIKFCNKLSEKKGLTPCYSLDSNSITCNWQANGYRLPTEAEWEYAARSKGREDRQYSGTNRTSFLNQFAWYSHKINNNKFTTNLQSHLVFNSPMIHTMKTHRVGTKKPNDLGIYDMSGNVAEWCWDRYSDKYYMNSTVNNPKGPKNGQFRVIRGGSWGSKSNQCSTIHRSYTEPNNKKPYIGFRIVRNP